MKGGRGVLRDEFDMSDAKIPAANSEHWSGRTGFILATVGSAVGIGSIWKFPYELGAHGGSAFLLFYLAGLALIVVPLMFAEFAIGRAAGANRTVAANANDPPACIAAVALGRATRGWQLIGYLGVLTGFLILSYYSVIGGWTLAHALETLSGGLSGADPLQVRARHDALLASPVRMLMFHGLFIGAAAWVVARGVQAGIEAASKVLMPLLAVLMLGLALYSMIEGDTAATVRFLFRIDPSALTAKNALQALGLGFFSIGVGLGLMITYAAYAGREINLKTVAIASVVADSAISLAAGFAVFPIVFAHGLDPASGAGLVFVTLPIAFAQMPFGTLAAILFFVLLFVAALSSTIAMLEIVVVLGTRQFGWSRPVAAAIAAAACFVCGIATVLSFNRWAGWFPLAAIDTFSSATVFDLLDYLTSNVLLPLGGIGIAVFAGWILPRGVLADALRLSPLGAGLLRFLLRYVAPVGIAAALIWGA